MGEMSDLSTTVNRCTLETGFAFLLKRMDGVAHGLRRTSKARERLLWGVALD
jgi:hypothetical protein